MVTVVGQEATRFLQVAECIGTTEVTAELLRDKPMWLFDFTAEGTEAMEQIQPPRVDKQEVIVMVLFVGGIAMRLSPHLNASKGHRLLQAYECQTVRTIVSTAEGCESYALSTDGMWIPCKVSVGIDVAAIVPTQPFLRSGSFEVIMKAEVPIVFGPYPGAPILPDRTPKGMSLNFNLLLWYADERHGQYLRLHTGSEYRGPALWIRNDPQIVDVHERAIL